MNFLILGGTGFIASHIVDRLLDDGHHIRIFDRTLKYLPENDKDRVEYVIADIANTKKIAKSLRDIDIVLHLASSTVPGSSNADPVSDIDTNLIGTVTLLQEMVRSGVQKIIYFSSGGTVYGKPEKTPIPEDHPKTPLCSYGITKMACEKYLLMFGKLYGLKPVILRPSNPFGPRQGRIGAQGAISTFADRIIRGEPLTVWGDGEVIRDYIYISDLVDATMSAIETQKTGVYNIGSGEGHSLLQIIAAIETETGLKAKTHFEPARDFDIEKIILDTSKAYSEFGWQPKTDFETGIKLHCDWVRNNLSAMTAQDKG